MKTNVKVVRMCFLFLYNSIAYFIFKYWLFDSCNALVYDKIKGFKRMQSLYQVLSFSGKVFFPNKYLHIVLQSV